MDPDTINTMSNFIARLKEGRYWFKCKKVCFRYSLYSNINRCTNVSNFTTKQYLIKNYQHSEVDARIIH